MDLIQCFHMTSQKPYLCFKTMKWRPCMLVYQTNPVGAELFPYVRTGDYLAPGGGGEGGGGEV